MVADIMTSLSDPTTADSEVVEHLLSDKLVEGYLLLEKACPSCATPLVKRNPHHTASPKEVPHPLSGSTLLSEHGDITPITGVPFCVWCQAHVVTDQSEVAHLERVSERLKIKGAILVSMQQQQPEERRQEEEHLSPRFPTETPKPFDEWNDQMKQKLNENNNREASPTVQNTQPVSPGRVTKSTGSRLDFVKDLFGLNSKCTQQPKQAGKVVVTRPDKQRVFNFDNTHLVMSNSSSLASAAKQSAAAAQELVVTESQEEIEVIHVEDAEDDNWNRNMVNKTPSPAMASPRRLVERDESDDDDQMNLFKNMSSISETIYKDKHHQGYPVFNVETVANKEPTQTSPVTVPKSPKKSPQHALAAKTCFENAAKSPMSKSPRRGARSTKSGNNLPAADNDDGSKCSVSIDAGLEVIETSHISYDEISLPSYDEQRALATKILGMKMIQGFCLTELQCNKCMMPLMEKQGSYFCVVCPVLKKNLNSLASLADDLSESVAIPSSSATSAASKFTSERSKAMGNVSGSPVKPGTCHILSSARAGNHQSPKEKNNNQVLVANAMTDRTLCKSPIEAVQAIYSSFGSPKPDEVQAMSPTSAISKLTGATSSFWHNSNSPNSRSGRTAKPRNQIQKQIIEPSFSGIDPEGTISPSNAMLMSETPSAARRSPSPPRRLKSPVNKSASALHPTVPSRIICSPTNSTTGFAATSPQNTLSKRTSINPVNENGIEASLADAPDDQLPVTTEISPRRFSSMISPSSATQRHTIAPRNKSPVAAAVSAKSDPPAPTVPGLTLAKPGSAAAFRSKNGELAMAASSKSSSRGSGTSRNDIGFLSTSKSGSVSVRDVAQSNLNKSTASAGSISTSRNEKPDADENNGASRGSSSAVQSSVNSLSTHASGKLQTEEQLSPCLQLTKNVLDDAGVNPFAWSDEMMALAIPSIEKQKTLDVKANQQSEVQKFSPDKIRFDGIRQDDMLVMALKAEKNIIEKETLHLRELEERREAGETSAYKGLLSGLKQNVQRLFNDEEDSLEKEIAAAAKARDEAEAKIVRLFKERRMIADSRSRERHTGSQPIGDGVKADANISNDISDDSPSTDNSLLLGMSRDQRTHSDEDKIAYDARADTNHAEDPHGLKRATDNSSNHWETLRVEGRAVMTRRLMSDWVLSDKTCAGSECQRRPILMKGDVKQCAVCGGSGSGEDGLYSSQHSKEISAPRLPMKQASKRTLTSSIPAVRSNGGKEEEKRNLASKEIGKRMMKGWSILDASCPVCVMPLMTDLDKKSQICVLCGVVGATEDKFNNRSLRSWSTGANSSKTSEINTTHEAPIEKLHRRNILDEKDARIQQKTKLLRERVIDQTAKAEQRLKMDNTPPLRDLDSESLISRITRASQNATYTNSLAKKLDADDSSKFERHSIDPGADCEQIDSKVNVERAALRPATSSNDHPAQVLPLSPQKSNQNTRADPPTTDFSSFMRVKPVDAPDAPEEDAHKTDDNEHKTNDENKDAEKLEMQASSDVREVYDITGITLEFPDDFDMNDENVRDFIKAAAGTIPTAHLHVKTDFKQTSQRAAPSPGMERAMMPRGQDLGLPAAGKPRLIPEESDGTIESSNTPTAGMTDPTTDSWLSASGVFKRLPFVKGKSLETMHSADPSTPSTAMLDPKSNSYFLQHRRQGSVGSAGGTDSLPPFESALSPLGNNGHMNGHEDFKQHDDPLLETTVETTRRDRKNFADLIVLDNHEHPTVPSLKRAGGTKEYSRSHHGNVNQPGANALPAQLAISSQLSNASFSSRPRITPESMVRTRTSLSSFTTCSRDVDLASSERFKVSSPASESKYPLTGLDQLKLSSLTESSDGFLVGERSYINPIQQTTAFSIPSGTFWSTAVAGNIASRPRKQQNIYLLPGISANEVNLDGFDAESVVFHGSEPETPQQGKFSCMASQNKGAAVFTGGPLLQETTDAIYLAEGKDVHYNDEEVTFEAFQYTDNKFLVDDDGHSTDGSVDGSTSLDEVILRIEEAKMELTQTNGDEDKLRRLIDGLAQAAAEIEKEDRIEMHRCHALGF